MAATNPIAHSKKQKALKLLQQGNAPEAVNILEQLITKYPKDIEALSILGTVYGQAGELERAVHYLEQVVAINPKDIDALNNLGVASMMLGDKAKARDYAERVVKLQPDDIGAMYNLACVLQEQHELDQAIEYFKKVLQREPNAIDALVNLGVAQKETDRFDEALETFRQAIKLDPKSAEANLNLGYLLARSGSKDEAVQYLEQAAASAPGDFDKIRALANMRVLEGQPEAAIAIYEKALAQTTNDARIHREFARLLFNLGRHDDAVMAISKSLDIDPDDSAAMLVQASLFNEASATPRAIEIVERVLEIDNDNIDALLILANLYSLRGQNDKAMQTARKAQTLSRNIVTESIEIELLTKTGRYEEAIRLLEPLLDTQLRKYPIGMRFAKLCKQMNRCDEAAEYLSDLLTDYSDSVPITIRRSTLFELGKLYDGFKQADKAFDLFKQANALKSTRFDCRVHHSYVDALATVFSRDNLDNGNYSTIESERPMFIVGMPRSGTSLTEQIVASHHAVHGAGELGTIAQCYREIEQLMAQRAANGEVLELTTADCDQFAQRYLDEIEGYSKSAKLVTDKMPTNFLYLGLIQQLFPKTRIIHTLRNPLDVCLSIYSLDFAGRHPYAYDLENLGCFYNEYRRIMKHWYAVLDLPIMDIQYEDLVNDQEAWSRKLIDFCGLEWDDACLQFHKSDRVVNTASNEQVRQPIYKGSMQRWRPYAKHLKPLIDALEPEYRREAGVEDWDY